MIVSYVRGTNPYELKYRRSLIETYTSQNNITISKSFEDISLGEDLNRLGIQQLMNYVANKQVKWILVNSVHQLGTDINRINELIKDIFDYSTRLFVVNDENYGMEVNTEGDISSF